MADLQAVLNQLEAASKRTASPETVATAQRVSDDQATGAHTVKNPITGEIMTSAELLAQGYTFVNGTWVPPQGASGGTNAGATPHLDTRQSQRAGIGGLSTGGSSLARPGVFGGGQDSAAQPTFRRDTPSATQRLMEQFRRNEIAAALGGGGANGLAGVGPAPGLPNLYQQPAEAQPTAQPNQTIAGAPGGAGGAGGPTSVQTTVRDTPIQTTNEDALGLLSQLIAQGGTPATQQSSANQQAGQSQILNTLQGLAGMASGQTTAPLTGALQGISRDFRENVFPQISRSAETAGSSKSALAALLENDANTRLQEAQAAQALQAQQQAVSGQAQLAQVLQNLGQVDPLSQELLALLGAGARLPGNDIIPLSTTTASTIV